MRRARAAAAITNGSTVAATLDVVVSFPQPDKRRPEAARLRELHDEERRLATAVLFHGGDPAQLQATRNALHTERLRLKA